MSKNETQTARKGKENEMTREKAKQALEKIQTALQAELTAKSLNWVLRYEIDEQEKQVTREGSYPHRMRLLIDLNVQERGARKITDYLLGRLGEEDARFWTANAKYHVSEPGSTCIVSIEITED